MSVRSRQQVFNPGELPLVLLALLEQRSWKAYDLIAELDRLFGPSYRASPGGVYPALTALRDEGLLVVERDGRARRYETTEVGRQALASRRRQLAAFEERTGVQVSDADSLRPYVDKFADRVMRLSGTVPVHQVAKILDAAAEEIEELREQ